MSNMYSHVFSHKSRTPVSYMIMTKPNKTSTAQKIVSTELSSVGNVNHEHIQPASFLLSSS